MHNNTTDGDGQNSHAYCLIVPPINSVHTFTCTEGTHSNLRAVVFLGRMLPDRWSSMQSFLVSCHLKVDLSVV